MPVTDAELSELADSYDIIKLGMLGDEARRRLHGARTTFVRVARVTAGSLDACGPFDAAGEVRIEGMPASRAAAVDRVRQVRAAAGDRPLSAFSLADLEQLAATDGVTLRALLEELQAAGLELVSEAPIDRLQSPRRSIEEVNIAGLALSRLTVHRLADAAVVPFMKTVAELQKQVAVVRAFAPLPRVLNPAVPTTGYDDVKRIALARLTIDNIPSIQVDWALYGPKLAQVALTVGADDLDGVAAGDDLSQGPRRTPLEEVRRNIVAAGLQPAERNGRFEPISA